MIKNNFMRNLSFHSIHGIKERIENPEKAQQELPQNSPQNHPETPQTTDLPSIELSASENILALQSESFAQASEHISSRNNSSQNI